MADARADGDEHAHGRVRHRGAAGRRGDDDARPVPVARVTLYHADGCHLCEDALEALRAVQSEHPFELELVAIDGNPELERRYRALLPVVEIDGERAFELGVEADELRERLALT